MPTAPVPIFSSQRILVHREGFEPSYLRGGADLQSAGFNHSPTCAELQNSPAFVPASGIHRRFSRQRTEIVQTDFAKVRICKREEQKCARKCYRTQTPHL